MRIGFAGPALTRPPRRRSIINAAPALNRATVDWQVVLVILALGVAAMPILIRLARSKNPAARAVAAMGFGNIESDAARVELHRLEADREYADTLDGCMGSRRSVSSFAKGALNRR